MKKSSSKGHFHKGRYSANWYCSPTGASQKAIRLSEFCRQANISKNQAKTLARKGYLLMTKQKSVLFVYELNPDWRNEY